MKVCALFILLLSTDDSERVRWTRNIYIFFYKTCLLVYCLTSYPDKDHYCDNRPRFMRSFYCPCPHLLLRIYIPRIRTQQIQWIRLYFLCDDFIIYFSLLLNISIEILGRTWNHSKWGFRQKRWRFITAAYCIKFCIQRHKLFFNWGFGVGNSLH